jgi:hypothetical protein
MLIFPFLCTFHAILQLAGRGAEVLQQARDNGLVDPLTWESGLSATCMTMTLLLPHAIMHGGLRLVHKNMHGANLSLESRLQVRTKPLEPEPGRLNDLSIQRSITHYLGASGEGPMHS